MHKVQNEVRKKDLNDILIKGQKIVVFTLLFSIIIFFVYSLIFMTPFYDLIEIDGQIMLADLQAAGINYQDYPETFWYLNKRGKVIGMLLDKCTAVVSDPSKAQTFNHWMFNTSLIGIIITLVLFVYFSQKRRRYYVTNFVSFGAVLGFDLYAGISLVSKLQFWSNEINTNLKLEVVNAYQNSFPTPLKNFSIETYDWIFSVGYGVAILLFVAIALGLVLVVLKGIYQIKNAPIDISEVKIDE